MSISNNSASTRAALARLLRWSATIGLLAGLILSTLSVASADELPSEASATSSALGDSVVESAEASTAISEKRYPKLPLMLLNPEQRVRLVKIAQGELCPCDGVFDSLDVCLQKEDGACRLAGQVAVLAMRKIKEGEDDSEAMDAIVKAIERARKVYTFNLDKTPHKGTKPADAKVTLVEFADFECPYCSKAGKAVSEITKKYGSKGLTVYFKQFPLGGHKHSEIAARASLAAHLQGKFWPMHDILMGNQRDINPENIMGFAKKIGLNMDRFKADLESDAIKAQVNDDRSEGNTTELDGTPSFFLNGVRFEGSLEDLEQAIADRLKD